LVRAAGVGRLDEMVALLDDIAQSDFKNQVRQALKMRV
jgi:hypothetical protein